MLFEFYFLLEMRLLNISTLGININGIEVNTKNNAWFISRLISQNERVIKGNTEMNQMNLCDLARIAAMMPGITNTAPRTTYAIAGLCA